jgi:hypothetical protein
MLALPTSHNTVLCVIYCTKSLGLLLVPYETSLLSFHTLNSDFHFFHIIFTSRSEHSPRF